MDIDALKAGIRKEKKAARAALSPDFTAAASQKMLEHFLRNVSLRDVKTVHVFMSSAQLSEPDTSLFLNYFRKLGLRIVIPLTIPSEDKLLHVWLDEDVRLEKNQWGIPEPVSRMQFVPVSALDLVLVPVLAYDDRGYRLGFGKGYYDRFLALLKPGVPKIGLAFSLCRVEGALPFNEYDVALDALVNENEYVDFSLKR